MEIKSGKITEGAKRVIIYGPEGIGKSTFASKFPSPVFIDTEKGTRELDVARYEADFSRWETILEAAEDALKNRTMKTLVIDTLDWAEQACLRMLNAKHKTDNILTMDYGRGSLYAVAEFERLLGILGKLAEAGVNVVLVGHAAMRKQELPDEMGAFDRWEMKIQSKHIKSMVKEWADMVLFANYQTFVVEDDKTKSKKAQGGRRVMYTQHSPTWDAKNRYGLGDCLPFDYAEIKGIIEGRQKKKGAGEKEAKAEAKPEAKPEAPNPAPEPEAKPEAAKKSGERPEIAELKALMKQDGISEERLLYACAMKIKDFVPTTLEGLDENFIRDRLISKWAGFVKYAKKFTDGEIELAEIPFMPFG